MPNGYEAVTVAITNVTSLYGKVLPVKIVLEVQNGEKVSMSLTILVFMLIALVNSLYFVQITFLAILLKNFDNMNKNYDLTGCEIY